MSTAIGFITYEGCELAVDIPDLAVVWGILGTIAICDVWIPRWLTPKLTRMMISENDMPTMGLSYE